MIGMFPALLPGERQAHNITEHFMDNQLRAELTNTEDLQDIMVKNCLNTTQIYLLETFRNFFLTFSK